jgi:hypothetical protein
MTIHRMEDVGKVRDPEGIIRRPSC